MISGIEKNESSHLARHVMERIRVVSECIKTNDVGMIEKYYQEHGTYNGIED